MFMLKFHEESIRLKKKRLAVVWCILQTLIREQEDKYNVY